MTILLQQAFEKASQLPEDILRINWRRKFLRILLGNSSGTPPLAQSEDLLEQLAAQEALREFEAGRTRPQGFDEL